MKDLKILRKLCLIKILSLGFCTFVLFDLSLLVPGDSAHAIVRGGRGGGGGFRTTTRTTVRPGTGVTRSTTVAGGRYYRPTTLPAHSYVPGVPVAGSAVRTARRTARRVAYRTASGYSYYYGSPVVVLPTPACYSVIWQGMSVYNCNGAIYILEGGQNYPIEG